MRTILVVDDEKNMRLVLTAMLRRKGYDVVEAADGVEAQEILRRRDISVVVSDLKMPRLDGFGLLSWIGREYPSLPFIIITAYGTISNAVEAVKKGAFDYITKPFDQEELQNIIGKAVNTKNLTDREPRVSVDETERDEIIGSSAPMQKIYDIVRTVAPTTTTVLVQGETGTGKELVARAVHNGSPRKDNPFIKINCAAIPENLLESELFGFEKGAFTGALHKKIGRFEQAHGGTLFLDEIGDLPRDMQAKLLRVIQDQEFERVGGLRTVKVDVRLVAATNRDLRKDVENGDFREDLYYRINVVPLELPPLRERKDDIPSLASFFLHKFNRKLERRVEDLDPDVMDRFMDYHWPGNIREMENLLERLVLLAPEGRIRLEDLPPDVSQADGSGKGSDYGAFKEVIREKTESMEREMIENVLSLCDGNVTQASRRLGLSRKALQLKMIKYGLRK
ncbi:MAG: Fis family transcriptional regulator [delta proteobacterium MLS_D]|jgi:two-component system, NtrC family, response regulator AtoC|nr:MAG: Fis family transcriptional regulator [delta proteobacterium MLS_D]